MNILKPIYATLREKGHLNVGYIEDLYLQGDMIRECQSNVIDTCCLFTRLGFVIHCEIQFLDKLRHFVSGFLF